ncbi:succinate dehydrogenase hydrophobic anchor subunit [Bacillus pakistanensis]|uniref:Succinate dehydrogenase hydrophobic anchor subunit n=1 Tax=Rossellomorea pakistanensis TaxID=992288 RepID=A0ABS2NIK2_9BACI|nr:ABC-2 transporter permease [Bacillus pakistanensis]MBM7587700.1 succinate dehydrogenase hydrophobic anchor subunit [Bacillus pakistanensis]
MVHILKKDLLVNKSYLWLILAFLAAFYIMNFPTQIIFFMIAFGVLVNTFYYDEKSKADIYYVSLPIKRSNLVLFRYLFFFLFSLCLALVMLVVDYGLREIFSDYIKTERLNWVYIVGVVVMFLLFTSTLLPFLYKFGLMKGMAYCGLFLLIIIGSIMMSESLVGFLSDLALKILSINPILMPLSIGLLFILVSGFISVFIYEKKDLG